MRKNKILELKFWLIPFWLLMFCLIIFTNFRIFLFIFVLFVFIYIFFWYKYQTISFLFLIFWLWMIVLVSYVLFEWKNFDNIVWYNKHFTKKVYVVEDNLWDWRYLVKDDYWWTFLVKDMKKWFKLWDKVKIYGFFVPIDIKDKLLYSWNIFNEDIEVFVDWKQIFTKIFFYFPMLNKNKFKQLFWYIKKRLSNLFKFDYTNYLIMKWIYGIIYSKQEYKIWNEKLPFYKQIRQMLSDKIKKIYKNYDDKYKALILWLLIWDKSLLSRKLYKQFIHSGLVHIIVVSWWNMMFLIILLSILLFFVPFYVRLILIWIGVIIYSTISWADSSVIRATIMWLLWLIALFFWKIADTKRLLWISFMLMLLYNPYFMLYDLWFILSFLAILWILYFNRFQINISKKFKKIIKEKIKYWYTVFYDKIKYYLIFWVEYFYNNYIIPTLWASIFTAPAILLFTWQVNVFSSIASMIVVPIVPIVMIDSLFVLLMSNLSITLTNIWVYVSIYLIDWIFYISWLFGEKIVFFMKI